MKVTKLEDLKKEMDEKDFKTAQKEALEDLVFERKMKKQRKEKGYCDRDVWDIDRWFLSIMPKIIHEFIESVDSFPSVFLTDYYEKRIKPFGLCTEEEFFSFPKNKETKALLKKADQSCFRRWKNILKSMERAFLDASEDTCSYKNKYEEAFHVAFQEYEEKYGRHGEKVKDNPYVKHLPDGATSYQYANNPYLMENLDEYKDIYKLYYDEEHKIEKYREKSEKKAFKYFIKYFHHLWS